MTAVYEKEELSQIQAHEVLQLVALYIASLKTNTANAQVGVDNSLAELRHQQPCSTCPFDAATQPIESKLSTINPFKPTPCGLFLCVRSDDLCIVTWNASC
mmetsp:Transcript_1118/g.1816  ORF Transcript_1118/g.1816 Transcript_1118/m.1816 type:complete len:101 (+) Transcript_1118:76-378(+)